MSTQADSNGTAPVTRAEMTFDFDGLIQLLVGHLYSEKKVFIRELIQNGHDAVVRRAHEDQGFDRDQGRIHILTDLTAEPGRIIFRDNGLGMSRGDLERFLSAVGRSGTRAAAGDAPDVIGQFGIGFLSGFVVGARVTVHTRHWQEPPASGSLWENDGTKDCSIRPCTVEQPGTEVIVHLASADDRGLLQDQAVKDVIRNYADILKVPIYLNDPSQHASPVNQRVMPRERGIYGEELRLDSLIYLEKTVPDSVLEVIPVREHGEHGVDAQGLLYITRTRVVGRDAPRTIRVFLKRMFLCENAKELLPPWATFVNGILNTRDLKRNAARDNFAREDPAYHRQPDDLSAIRGAEKRSASAARPNLPTRLYKTRAAADWAMAFARKLDTWLQCDWRQREVTARRERIEAIAAALGTPTSVGPAAQRNPASPSCPHASRRYRSTQTKRQQLTYPSSR